MLVVTSSQTIIKTPVELQSFEKTSKAALAGIECMFAKLFRLIAFDETLNHYIARPDSGSLRVWNIVGFFEGER